MKPSKAFQEWFGNSKVVHPDGAPRLVYHGTHAESIDVFETEEREVSWAGKDIKFTPFYFTSSTEVAATYGANTVDVYLSLQNPKILNARGGKWENFGVFGKIIQAIEAGHDGVIIKSVKDDASGDGSGHIASTVYVAFQPEQIKSAIGNNGDFDPASNNITESKIRDQADTPAFKKWFGDSKVVNKDGTPRVFYHGTGSDFSAFESAFMYSGEGASQTGSGFYFTSAADSASRYALRAGADGGQVMPVYLSLQNPLHIDFIAGEVRGADITLTAKQVRQIITFIPTIRDVEESPLLDFGDIAFEGFETVLARAVKSYAGTSGIVGLRNDFFNDDHAAWLKAFSEATGFDSAYATTKDGDTHYVAWFPYQIKSALGNNGDFDANNPDIRFSERLLSPPTDAQASFFHASPHSFDFPDFNLLKANIVGHDNGGLGLWVANDADWIKGFGSNIYSLTVSGREQSLALSDLSAWNSKGPEFYSRKRDELLSQGIDYLRIIELNGRSDMAIVVNFEAISSFKPVAPKTTPSPVNQTDTEAFGNWFGSSTVVDTDGKARKVFHATRANFSVFDPSRSNPSSRFGPGLYFTSDAKTLNVYADSAAAEAAGLVMPVYLQIERPQTDNDLTAEQVENFFAVLQVKTFPNGYDATADHVRIKERALSDLSCAFGTLLSGQVAYIDSADWLRGMDAIGIDGIVREVFGHPEYVVFRSEQVKSAIGNNGDFDALNPDIRYSNQPRETNTQSTEIAPQKINSVDLSKWLQGSAVVHADGKPMMVYHGTQASFSVFEEEMQGSTVWSEDVGFFFTNDPAEASSYATLDWDKEDPKPNVMPVYLSIKNPLVVTLQDDQSPYDNPAIWYDHEGRDAVERAQAAGHDGLIVRDERSDMALKDGTQPTLFVPFKPEQIKSAIGNIGSFDLASADIRYSQPGQRTTNTLPESIEVPDVLYHGSPSESGFSKFDPDSSMDSGIYFTADKALARSFTLDEDGEYSGTLFEARLKLRNPITIDLKGEQQPSQESMHALYDAARAQGHDSAVLLNVIEFNGTGIQYVAFDADQITSKVHTEPVESTGAMPVTSPLTADKPALAQSMRNIKAFHGTTQGDIPAFEARERGIYFTSSARQAEGYTTSRWLASRGNSPTIYPVFLSIENPLVIDALGKRNDNIPVPWQQWKPKVFGNLPRNAVSIEAAFAYAIKQGYDGLVVKNVVDTALPDEKHEGDVYVVASPDQIRSAIGRSLLSDTPIASLKQTDMSAHPGGNSRIVTAFHGTASEFQRFRLSTRGSFGAGIYFADEKAARAYAESSHAISGDAVQAPRIIAARLYFDNPLECTADYAAGEQVDFDSPAVPLLRRLFGDQAERMIEHARSNEGDGAFGHEIRVEAIRQGFDGLIVTYPDQSKEFVAFHARQVQTVGVNALRLYEQESPSAVMNSFAGTKANTAPAGLQRAQEQANSGSSTTADEVRRETGWFMGMDGKWRFEISDDEAKVLPLHKNLRTGGFEAREIESASYLCNDDGTFRVTLNPPNPRTVRDFVHLDHLDEVLLNALLPAPLVEKMKAGAGREDYLGDLQDARCITHAFHFEGFNALPLDRALSHPALFKAYPELGRISVRVDPRMGLGAQLAILDTGDKVITTGLAFPEKGLLHEIQHAIQDIEGFAAGGLSPTAGATPGSRIGMAFTPSEIAAADYYHRLAGEVEARNTARRAIMTAAQRRQTPPAATADVPAERAIVEPVKLTSPAMATSASVRTAIAELFGADFAGSTAGASDILVVQASELGPEQGRVFSHVLMSSLAAQNRNLSLKTLTTLAHTVSHACAQAFFERKSASITMVADRIYAGQETAVLMHELVHKHGQKALGETSWRGLVDQVKNWRDREPDSVERKIYNAAIRRANAVRTPAQSVDVYDEELFAYAVESAVAMGVKPSAHGAAHGAERWLASVIESIERVGQKLTGKVPANLSTQDIVDLAYALAQLETPRYAQTVREAMQRAGLSHQLYEQPQDLPESDEASSASQLDAAAMHSLGLQEGRPAWHSALHKALSACSMKSAPAHGWLSYLKGLPNKGIKPEEIQWSTLPDWLKFQEGISNSISKAQVLGYFQDNGVQVTEVLLGGDAVRYQKAVDRLESAGFELEYDDYFGVLLARASDGEPVEPHSLTTEQFLDFTLLNSNEAENPLVDGSALYANLQLPGGKKYRELLLTTTLAASKDWSLLAQLTVEATTDGGVDRFFIARGGVMNVYPKTYSSRAEAELAIEQLIERPQSPFRSTHWSEDNVVAHIRFNEREDALGSRILFVEEIQSDWGQQGKRRGFVNDETTVEGKTASHWQSEAQDLFGKWSQSDDDIYMQWEKAIQTARALREKYKAMGLGDVVEIPSGPFVQNTQAWVSLAIRRLVAYAVENDFDRVAFINGEQSYARYAKQKCISTLEWSKSDDGCLTLNMFNAVDESWSESQYSLAAACKCIGDELFQRIMASPETQGTFSDLELVTGGDGMRFFYDTIVPGTARKVIEKLGGLLAPVAIVTPPSDNISVQPYGNRWTAVDTTAHNAVVGSFDSKGAADEFMDITQRDYTGFTITPEMYEMVGRGLPLFSVAADASTPSPASA